MSDRARIAVTVVIVAALAPASAAAATPLRDALPPAPGGYEVSARTALVAADSDPKVREAKRQRGALEALVEEEQGERWEVKYFAPAEGPNAEEEQTNLVVVSGSDGEVLESWTGDAVSWPLARGRQGQFGHLLNAPYVWLPLCAVFLFALFDFRRPRRLAHLDLLALLAFGVGHIWFNAAEIGVSVPLAYPPLVYLLGRMLWIGFRGLPAAHALRPSAPTAVLVLVLLALVGGRIALNLTDSGVIDVGYASVVGADRLADGEPIYGERAFPFDNPHGDTYGPSAYALYVPFEQVLPWSGSWDELPAAHAAAIFFDLATIAGLFVLGRVLFAASRRPEDDPSRAPPPSIAVLRHPGDRIGVICALGWAAYPYTAFALQSNTNDGLVAALVVWALVAFSRPIARGALLALAALSKFAPLALVPLFLTGERGIALRPSGGPSSGWRAAARRLASTAAAFAGVGALLLAHPAVDPGLATFWERTVASQAERDSPFSIWGQTDLGPLRLIAAAGVAGLVVALAFVPRRRTLSQVCALAAAALIATQLTIEHWFYLYIPWFAAPLLAAIAVVSIRGRAERE